MLPGRQEDGSSHATSIHLQKSRQKNLGHNEVSLCTISERPIVWHACRLANLQGALMHHEETCVGVEQAKVATCSILLRAFSGSMQSPQQSKKILGCLDVYYTHL